jgi:rhodanese-related sulfurtransferase
LNAISFLHLNLATYEPTKGVRPVKERSSASLSKPLFFAVPLIAVIFVVLSAGTVMAEAYNYIAPDALKSKIESGADLTIIDIQVKEEFDQHHIDGVLATYAYPVKSDEERARLEAACDHVASGSDLVVIVCPRGGGGAKRTYDYLAGKGISTDRLSILEKGQAGWPYGELLEGSNK